MFNHYKLRNLMAENGYEHTPDEVKLICDRLQEGITAGLYEELSQMDEEDMEELVQAINFESDEPITVEEFKEIREFIMEFCDDL